MKKYALIVAAAAITLGAVAAEKTTSANVETVASLVVAEAPADDCSDEIVEAPEQLPEYPGGEMALMRAIAQRMVYPASAAESGIQGRVVVKFIVEKDGSIGEVKVVRGKDPDLDKEAVRVVKSITTKFSPGKMKGEPVRVWYTLPITFKLTN